MKKNLAVFLVALLCIAPIAASALTTDEVQTKIQILLAQISTLTAQIKALQGQITIPGVVPAFPIEGKHRVCMLLERNLSQGVRGEDVRGLQEFLKEQGYLNAEASGYFGALTSEAVRRWQAAQGVDAVGIIGPKTRERIKIWCGGGNHENLERFNAMPQQGNAPLTVTFNTYLSGFRVPSISYTIDFGDGSSERAVDCPAPADACIGPGQNTHTYTNNGTYVATLNKVIDPCPDDGDPMTPRCLAAVQNEVVEKAQIVVGPTACTKEYKPVCGLKQVVCITAPCNPVPTTYSNVCMLRADGASLAYEGTCRTDTSDPSLNPQCKQWFDGCNSCSRSEPNGLAMCTLRACTPESMQKPYCTGYFGDSSKAPTISGFSGPTNLRVNETGTWTVKASDPEGQQLSYYVSWGDEVQYASGISTSLPVFTQTSAFTHTYSTAGTYVVSVVARDVDGKEAKVSITVKVSRDTVACTTQYDPVCGRPSGCVNTCPAGMYCTLECRLYDHTTYSNRCALAAAGAEYLYAGSCQQ